MAKKIPWLTLLAVAAGLLGSPAQSQPTKAHRRPGLKLGSLGREQTRVHDLRRASLSSQGWPHGFPPGPPMMPVARVVEVAHVCPSGAMRYRRLDGAPDECAPPVNLISVRESGPYAFRGQLQIDGEAS